MNDVNYSIQKSPKSKVMIVHVDRMVKYFGEVPKCWLESEVKTVTMIRYDNLTGKTHSTESEDGHNAAVVGSSVTRLPDVSSVSAIQGHDNQRGPVSACREDATLVRPSKDTGFFLLCYKY